MLENGIDLNDFRRRRTQQEAKRELGIPEKRLLIGAAGRLSIGKRASICLLIRVVEVASLKFART